MRDASTLNENRAILRKLAIVAVVMFGFGWALVPLYRKICEITGINVVTSRDADARANTQVDTSRQIVVEFDVNARGSLQMRPHVGHVKVHPGELVQVEYDLVNTQPRPVVGQAIPSYAPALAGAHLRKLECFCFEQQTLQAHEVRRFPVVFYVDPKLPADVQTVTLSYTFFEVAGAVRKEAAGESGPRS